MDFEHLSDADIDRLVDQARSGEGPDWLHELRAELALGPVGADRAAGLVAQAALAARAEHERRAPDTVVPMRRRRRAKVAAVISAAFIVNVGPLAAADELPFEPRYTGSVLHTVRSGIDTWLEPRSAGGEESARAIGTADEVIAPPPSTATPSTTAPTAPSTTDPATDSEPPVTEPRDEPDYLTSPLELTPADPDPQLGTPPTLDELCEGIERAELDPADVGVDCEDPDDADPPGDGEPSEDDDTVMPPPPPPPTTAPSSTTTTTRPADGSSGS